MSIDLFKSQLSTLPQNSGDFNFICAATYAEYNVLLMMAKGFMLPFQLVHSNIQNAIDLLDESTFNFFKSTLDDVNGVIKDFLQNPIKDLHKISADIGRVGNTLAHSCEFFLSTLPPSLFNMFQDLQYGLLDIIDGLIDFPNSLTNSILDSLMQFKTGVLTSLLGALYQTILLPLLAFEMFMKEMGIVKLLDTLEKMEVCMMRGGSCTRDPRDFQEPTSHKPWSKYLKEQFMVTPDGRPNFNTLSSDGIKGGRAYIIHNNVSAFLNY